MVGAYCIVLSIAYFLVVGLSWDTPTFYMETYFFHIFVFLFDSRWCGDDHHANFYLELDSFIGIYLFYLIFFVGLMWITPTFFKMYFSIIYIYFIYSFFWVGLMWITPKSFVHILLIYSFFMIWFLPMSHELGRGFFVLLLILFELLWPCQRWHGHFSGIAINQLYFFMCFLTLCEMFIWICCFFGGMRENMPLFFCLKP